ncbi:MAG: type II toxin-antitoxin system VapC family toxin [Gammaproteobacteria bacterium]|nr:type II toxin-antitoxin system VapC family toxin [Gammaproteobacteria bacterium]NIR81983.1 type II toxin-antitoxin system VapC family toxin [Gammaproteobacteria bacterium]NIR89040.1 type II toxin-antitoxin system VapC family toxin [Gammaproteobacteria bacterium]NIU03090.1 type II toxin-antitoxin system VapC family toxin [Gammaproteobacteria bacterium]NIV50614.1 PIN domain-containing protein [Gammaproteobacteria bacterium]
MSLLFDTDVLVDHLRGVTAARDALLTLGRGDDRAAISVITVAEIEAGLREQERPAVEHLFAALAIQDVTEPIVRQAGRYRASFGASHGVLLPDAIIAATARVQQMPLVTLNKKHYPMSDIAVQVPYQR